MLTWNEMQKVILNGSFESMGKSTLEEYARVKPPPLSGEWPLLWQQAQQQIARALEKIENQEKEEKEEARHREIHSRLEELKKPHWTVQPNFWITVIAALAAIVAAYFAWRQSQPEATPPPHAGVVSPANSQSTPQPSQSPPKP